jgi:hypothetical protein
MRPAPVEHTGISGSLPSILDNIAKTSTKLHGFVEPLRFSTRKQRFIREVGAIDACCF